MTDDSLEKKVVRTSPVLWVLGALLAVFLGALGSRALSDIADLFREPQWDEFRLPRVEAIEKERDALRDEPNPQAFEIRSAEHALSDEEQVLRSTEESWQTWLATRQTLGESATEDKAVRARRDWLDAERARRDALERALQQLRTAADPREAQLMDFQHRIDAGERAARDEYDAAHRTWTLKVLTARMALALPLLLIALLLWRRRQRSRYLTLLWGYWAFAAWMLLYGVGPYLPHYGGYAPLALATVTVIALSVSLVRFFNRQAPLRRRRLVDTAIARHRCPGCDRDYLVGREQALDVGLSRKLTVRHFDTGGLRPRACPGCGLTLFARCASCKQEQVAHLNHCAHCAAPWRTEDDAPATAA